MDKRLARVPLIWLVALLACGGADEASLAAEDRAADDAADEAGGAEATTELSVCDGLDDADCAARAECEWKDGGCAGRVTTCVDFADATTCGRAGCRWDEESGACGDPSEGEAAPEDIAGAGGDGDDLDDGEKLGPDAGAEADGGVELAPEADAGSDAEPATTTDDDTGTGEATDDGTDADGLAECCFDGAIGACVDACSEGAGACACGPDYCAFCG